MSKTASDNSRYYVVSIVNDYRKKYAPPDWKYQITNTEKVEVLKEFNASLLIRTDEEGLTNINRKFPTILALCPSKE